LVTDLGKFGCAAIRVAEHAPEGVPVPEVWAAPMPLPWTRVRSGEEVESEGDSEVVVHDVLAGEHGQGVAFGVVRAALE